MDGSMKFVQGDAIAGFIVVMINAIGGVAIGVSRGLDFSSAVSSFGVLTIGDGMVNIVPALLISVCAGLVVTRVSEKDSQGTSTSADVLQQMGSDPRILTMSAGVLLVLALVPGLPFLPFFVVAVGLLMMSAAKLKKWSENPQLIPRTVTIAGSTKLAVNGLFSAGLASQFALPETGRRPRWDVSEIVVAVDSGSAGRDLVQAGLAEFQLYYNQLREQFLLERGVSLPAVRLDCEATLEPSEYSVAVREQRARNGWWDAKRLFVPLAPSSCRLLGIKDLLETRHPYLSSLACWVAVEELGTEGLVRLGVKVLSPAQFLALEAFSAAVEVIEELVGVDEIKLQLDELRQQHRGLVDEILSSALISAAELADVFRRLIRDRVPVRDLKLILEGIAEYSATHGPFDNRQAFLHGAHQFLRKVLSRTVLQGALGPSGVLRTYTLSPTVEELLREASDEQSSYRAGLVLDPEFQLALRNSSGALFGPVLERGALPVVVLCSADVRLVVDEFLGKQLPSRQWYRTLSYDELDSRIPMESVGVLDCVLSGEA